MTRPGAPSAAMRITVGTNSTSVQCALLFHLARICRDRPSPASHSSPLPDLPYGGNTGIRPFGDAMKEKTIVVVT